MVRNGGKKKAESDNIGACTTINSAVSNDSQPGLDTVLTLSLPLSSPPRGKAGWSLDRP